MITESHTADIHPFNILSCKSI